jgi:hypothetical protein
VQFDTIWFILIAFGANWSSILVRPDFVTISSKFVGALVHFHGTFLATYLEDGTLTKAESINLGEEVAKGTTLFLCWGESISKGSRIRLGDTSI